MTLAHFTDAQLKKRLSQLLDEVAEDSTDRVTWNLIHEAEGEAVRRKTDRRHDVFNGYFAQLIRDDLAFDGCYGDEWATVDGEVLLIDDTEAESTTLLQCIRDEDEPDQESGAFYRWIPIAFGPIREATHA